MSYLLPSAVFLLMVSVGMSLKLTELAANWLRLNWSAWFRILFATFIVPPTLALLGAKLFHLTLAETAGLFLVGAAPGAPLLTRNMARKGFDMHMAASYQLWAALMVPVMIPLLVAAAGKLYDRDIWISPVVLLWEIAEKQFLPLTIGMITAWVVPTVVKRAQPLLNVTGNVVLVVMIVLMLIKTGSTLKALSPMVPLVALLIAVGSIAVMRVVEFSDPLVKQTFAICNANRHVGLALLLSGQYLHARNALPAVACYALIAPLVMMAYVKLYPVQGRASEMADNN
jgi:predicted Na+-dependent transporter